MSNDLLKRLYWPCADECGRYMRGCNLDELYQRTEETTQALDHMTDLIESLALDESAIKDKISALCVEIMNAYEQQGFINGIRMGAQLARELMPAAYQNNQPTPKIAARGEALE